MKFTLNTNMFLTGLVIGVVAAINIYNQVITPPGTINLQQLFAELSGPGVLMVLNYLGHTRDVDGSKLQHTASSAPEQPTNPKGE